MTRSDPETALRHVREDLELARSLVVGIQGSPASSQLTQGKARDLVYSALQRAERRLSLPEYDAAALASFARYGVDWNEPTHVQRLIDCFDGVLRAVSPIEDEFDLYGWLIRATSLWLWLTWPFRVWSRLGGWKRKLWFVVVPTGTAYICHSILALEPIYTIGITTMSLMLTPQLLKD